jgi:calcineurin-like phosphoesterase family protein
MQRRKFFTSDLHFFHKNVIKYCNRPYASVEEMNEGLISNWNADVKKHDIVYIIGDVFFCGTAAAEKILQRLNGEKRLIYGNHDKMIRKSKLLQSYFTILPDLYSENIDGIQVYMCHFPFMTWDKNNGSFMLHGHSHGQIPFDPTVRRLDVGVDCFNMAPVEWKVIKEKLLQVELRAGREDA